MKLVSFLLFLSFHSRRITISNCQHPQDLDTDFIEKLVSDHPNFRLEELVTHCLNENENQNKSVPKPTTDPVDHGFAEMVSLIPATTSSYFEDQTPSDPENETEHKDNEPLPDSQSMDVSNASHSLLNALPQRYHQYFQQHLNHADISKIIDIHSHLSLMYEQYKMQYGEEHSNYNQIKMGELRGCIQMVYKLMSNIHRSPNEDKYRRLRESNKAFQRKIAHIEGGKLLLALCGWDHIEDGADTNNDGMYIFNSSLTTSWIQMVVEFMAFYVEQEFAANLKAEKPMKSNESINTEIPIITDFPKKRLFPKNVKTGKPQRKMPKIQRLSPSELREQRLKNLGNVQAANYGTISGQNGKSIRGPIADKIMDLNAPNLRNELKQIGKRKHRKWINSRKSRKRIFTMQDIEALRKQEFERKAKGPPTKDAMDRIGKEALELTNVFRKEQGLPPLKWHQALCDIGKVHSKDMGEGKVPFSHQGFDERVKQYPFRPMSAAENVAMSKGLSDVAKVAVDGWIDSPGHRKNLLSHHDYCGIGVYRNYDGAYYLTQLFGRTN